MPSELGNYLNLTDCSKWNNRVYGRVRSRVALPNERLRQSRGP